MPGWIATSGEVGGLDDDALSPGAGQVEPPVDRCVALLGRGEVDEPVPGRRDQVALELGELGEVPLVGLGQRERSAFGGEDLERRERDAVEPVGRVDVGGVGVAEGLGVAESALDLGPRVLPTSRPRAAACSRTERPRAGACRAAAPTDAYWDLISSMALADHGQELAVEGEPVGLEGLEQRRGGLAQPVDELAGVGEERPAGAGVDDAGGAVADAEAAFGGVGVRGDDRDGPRAHVLLLAHDPGDAPAGVLLEGLRGVLEEAVELGGGDRRHRRRQVDQPARVDGEPAHDLERRGGVLLGDLDLAGVGGLQPAGAGDVVDPEHRRLAVAAAGASGRTGSYHSCSAGTETISRSG